MAGSKKPIGILALQGDFAAHAQIFQRLKTPIRMLRRVEDLQGLRGLILPGGESTTLIHLLTVKQMWTPLKAILQTPLPLFATCAGAILACCEVVNHPQKTLNLVNTKIERNSYGRQKESFETTLDVPVLGSRPLPAIFIRAPRFVSVGKSVHTLARYEEVPVLLRSKNCLLATFHSELSNDLRLPRYFLETMVTPLAD